MKTNSIVRCTTLLVALQSLCAQPTPTAPAVGPAPGPAPVVVAPPVLPPSPAMPVTIGTLTPGDFSGIITVDPTTGMPAANAEEVRFDLEFPGGRPEELVRYIEDAGVGTLNVIIPQDLADTAIPAMRVKGVTVPQLFEALTEASRKTVTYPVHSGGAVFMGGAPLQQKETSFGFRTRGTPSATSIWYFFAERAPTATPPPVPKVVRFYQLAPYLGPDRFTVDDITTAIQTGWRMLGDESPPTLNFHKDTQLLIALGTEPQLRIVEDVLSQLRPRTTPSALPPPGVPVAPRSATPMPPAEVVPPRPAAAPSNY